MSDALARLRTVSLDTLYHVGTMNPDDKGRWCSSYEGAGLSVSVHPDEWTRIAKLGGRPTWELTRTGSRFLDYRRLTKAQRRAIGQWAIDQGLLTRAIVWVVEYWDDELEDVLTSEFDDKEGATGEADFRAGHGNPDQDLTVKRRQTYRATTRLVEKIGFDPNTIAFEIAVTIYADEVANLDGVWWADTYAPEILSCPRGVIAARRLPQWQVVRIAEAARRPALPVRPRPVSTP